MFITHSKSLTVADGTNTNLVRPADWNSGHVGALTIGGNTSNASTWSGSNLVIAGGDNVTLKLSGNTLEVIGPAGGGGGGGASMYGFDPYGLGAERLAGQIGQNTIHFCPVDIPNNLVFDRVLHPIIVVLTTGSVCTAKLTQFFGIYTKDGSTLNLLHSFSAELTFHHNSNANSASNSGVRYWTQGVGATLTIPPGCVWVAVKSNTTRSSDNACVISNQLVSNQNSALSGSIGVAANASNQFRPGQGSYSVTSAGLPSSVAFSQIYGSAAANLRPQQWCAMLGTV